MSLQSRTVINVARQTRKDRARDERANVEHFFRVEIEEHPTHCAEEINEIKKRFPKKDGFEIDVTYWECVGRSVE